MRKLIKEHVHRFAMAVRMNREIRSAFAHPYGTFERENGAANLLGYTERLAASDPHWALEGLQFALNCQSTNPALTARGARFALSLADVTFPRDRVKTLQVIAIADNALTSHHSDLKEQLQKKAVALRASLG